MPSILKDLELQEVSLVDVPANPLAQVPLFKRHSESNMTKEKETNWEEMAKAYEAQSQELTQTVEDLSKKLAEAEDKLKTEVEKSEDFLEVGGEKIAKSALPESVVKHLEEVSKQAEKAEIEKKAGELLPNFKGTLEQRAKLLKSVNFDVELLELLQAADQLFANAFDEVGKKNNDGEMKTADERLNELAKNHAKDHKVTFEQGYAAVTKTLEGKSLLKEINKKG